MKAGDEDEKRYIPAATSYQARDGSCRNVSGTSAKTAQQLAARRAERGEGAGTGGCRHPGWYGEPDE